MINILKTKFEEIVNIDYIGKDESPIKLNDAIEKGLNEKIKENECENLVIGIDFQRDFIEGGSLGVKGSIKDIENFSKFIYNNVEKISSITMSLDTHDLYQIFFRTWWVDENDNFVKPFAEITLNNIDSGKYRALYYKSASRNYVEHLKISGKKNLTIWPEHCLKGTVGNTIDNQLSNMLHYYNAIKKTSVNYLVKGEKRLSEHYDIFESESIADDRNISYLHSLSEYEKIIIAGESKDYCVLTSIEQIVKCYKHTPEFFERIYILEDCMSSINPNDIKVKERYDYFRDVLKMNIVKSTDLKL